MLTPIHPHLFPDHHSDTGCKAYQDQGGVEAFHANLVNVLSKCAHEIGLAGFASQPFRFKSQASGPYTRLMGAVPMA